MDRVKVAVVGIGGYGGVVLKEAMDTRHTDFEIVAVADPYAQNSALYGRLKEENVPIYANVEDMYAGLEKKGVQVQLTYIATPIQFHFLQIECAVRNGSNVLCEKPMSGDERDIARLQELQKNTDKFIAIGYQWSFSAAIQALKADVMQGVFGKPRTLKSLVFWPRDKAYFTRSTGWAGKIYAANGEKILDSILNNATAHFLHNILYVLGETLDSAASVKDVQATLLRTNKIETFDTASVRFVMENGATGILAVSHSTEETVEPTFEYVFEKGRIVYSAEEGNILAVFQDGRKKEYGNPFAEGAANKFHLCVQAAKTGKTDVLCGVNSAKEQMKFIALLHERNAVRCVKESMVREKAGVLIVEGIAGLLRRCYEEEIILEETEEFQKIVEN